MRGGGAEGRVWARTTPFLTKARRNEKIHSAARVPLLLGSWKPGRCQPCRPRQPAMPGGACLGLFSAPLCGRRGTDGWVGTCARDGPVVGGLVLGFSFFFSALSVPCLHVASPPGPLLTSLSTPRRAGSRKSSRSRRSSRKSSRRSSRS